MKKGHEDRACNGARDGTLIIQFQQTMTDNYRITVVLKLVEILDNLSSCERKVSE
jgi:hypothetical protein